MPTPRDLELPVEFGNAETTGTNGTGWFIGFSEWAKSGASDLRFMPQEQGSRGLCMKWFAHPAGHPNGEDKPLSTGRTVSILVSTRSHFELEFSRTPSIQPESTVSHVLLRVGDFAIWGPGVYHRAFGREEATIVTLRWEPTIASPHLSPGEA
jgi:hypothetical protein